jgi:signal transduction histidine kinase
LGQDSTTWTARAAAALGFSRLAGSRHASQRGAVTVVRAPPAVESSYEQLAALNAKLEVAAHEWRTTADTIDAALIVLEPAGTILRMNRAAASTFSTPLQSWIGRPTAHLFDAEPWSAALGLMRDGVRQGIVATLRTQYEKSGRTWDLWCRRLQDVDERSAVLIMARDVTDVIELQASLRRSETMAALGEVVAGVAHEVRNPLFAISSLVDAWAVHPRRDPTPFVDALRSEVKRLSTLMNELLEYGKPAETTLQPQRLLPVIDAAVRACSHEAAARRIEVAIAGEQDADVLVDARRLERVFINLIQNALHHSPEHSIVTVEIAAPARPDATCVDIAVRDTGPGIAAEDLPYLFVPFFSRRRGGFGLGLAISERIVTQHHGVIAAANGPTGGAVMTVSLPLIQARPGRPAPAEAHRAQRPNTDCRR